MLGLLSRYARWLHTGWPAGLVEKLPESGPDGATSIPGVRLAGDLTGIPLLKFSADTGARAVQAFARELGGASPDPEVVDVAIVGGGVAGIAAALEAKKLGLRFVVLEASQPFSTIVNFPKAKPIYTYPTDMTPAGELRFTTDVKEALVEELEAQRKAAGIETVAARIERISRSGGVLELHHGGGHGGDGRVTRARRAVVAIGRSGNYRRLGVPGEELDKVSNRLHDPKPFGGHEVLVVGGGDTALETAIALAEAGAKVTLSYRGKELSRPKPENVARLEALGSAVRLELGTTVVSISDGGVVLRDEAGKETSLANDFVFTMIGREPPLDFFRRSGIAIRGEWTAWAAFSFGLFFAFCIWLYHWKSTGTIGRVRETVAATTLLSPALRKTLEVTLPQRHFYYSLAYSVCVVLFGVARIRRRKTPYVTAQTLTLMAFQVLPLFLLPYILLPWAGHAGWFDAGPLGSVADHLFPRVGYDHGREYWRAFGLVLAWPLFLWNLVDGQPNTWWLAISLVQTFVLIPLMVRRWGKGAYCGWICSCGALAETLGDLQRQKMPHGPRWNRLNLVGQAILAVAFALLCLRVVSWVAPASGVGAWCASFHNTALHGYKVVVDLWLAGVVGVGCYFWLSGRVWCRFACPLAALMHIYARFSRFRIFAEKAKCISCNVCTSVCHQGIDVMAFANKGRPMEDPECVRCSACVQSCPTGVLTFGRTGPGGKPIFDVLQASPVQRAEGRRLDIVS